MQRSCKQINLLYKKVVSIQSVAGNLTYLLKNADCGLKMKKLINFTDKALLKEQRFTG